MTWANVGQERPIVCGHRGAPRIEPENTLASFVAAATRGATWVEFDVRPTSDGVLVIHHDPSTAAGVRIASTPFVDLDSSIPRFGELVAMSPELGLDIEMKTDEIDITLDAFAEMVIREIDTHCDATKNLIVTSFDAEALQFVRGRRPDIATGQLFWQGNFAEALATAQAAGHVAMAPWIQLLTSEMVDQIRAASLDVLTWTVNEPEQVALAASLGVDMIIGDDPAVIIDHL